MPNCQREFRDTWSPNRHRSFNNESAPNCHQFFSKRECQMTSNYLAMLVMFAHLAIKERLISSNFFSERERQVTTAIRNEWLTKQIIQKENIFFHIHGTFKFIRNILFLTYVCISYWLLPCRFFIVLRSYVCRIIDIRT